MDLIIRGREPADTAAYQRLYSRVIDADAQLHCSQPTLYGSGAIHCASCSQAAASGSRDKSRRYRMCGR